MPTHVVNTHEAKSRLSELIREAEDGVEVIVARNGHPVAKIVPWRPVRPSRVPGAWASRVAYEQDVVATDDTVLAMFDDSAETELP